MPRTTTTDPPRSAKYQLIDIRLREAGHADLATTARELRALPDRLSWVMVAVRVSEMSAVSVSYQALREWLAGEVD